MSEHQIEALRERWDADPSPALAREVVRELGPVVVEDPAHLAANQLLAEAHTLAGELDRARDRLDLCRLLGGGEDLARLERQLSAAQPAALSASPEAEPFELPPLEAEQALTMDDVGPSLPGSTPAAAAGVRASADDEPFPLLDWLDFDEATYAAALFGEGLFVAPGTAAAAVQPSAAAEQGVPTLTLAELYRKQGHSEDAATMFREILERQPGNAEAARALGELLGDERWPLSADDLLPGPGDPNGPGEGTTAGELLRRYRDRLRGRS